MDMNLYSTIDLHDRHESETFSRAHHETGENRARSAPRVTSVTPAVAGSGWYHDAAIAQASAEAIEARSNPYR